MHTSHNEGGSQLEMQALRRMLFSATVGSTFSLPYSTCHSVSPSSFSSPAHLITPPPPKKRFFGSFTCCFQVQVAGCNLSKVVPIPLLHTRISRARPHVYIPAPIFGWHKVLSFLESTLHCCTDSSTCVQEPVCAILVNDPLLSFLPNAFQT